MATKDWKKQKSRNPYITHVWINKKKRLMIEIHYDIGFDKQRNVTVYDLSDHRLSGFNDLKTFYCENEKEAKEKATEYMIYN